MIRQNVPRVTVGVYYCYQIGIGDGRVYYCYQIGIGDGRGILLLSDRYW
jgi:hypothetical protein